MDGWVVGDRGWMCRQMDRQPYTVQVVNKQIPEHYAVHFPKMIVGDNEHTKSYKQARA